MLYQNLNRLAMLNVRLVNSLREYKQLPAFCIEYRRPNWVVFDPAYNRVYENPTSREACMMYIADKFGLESLTPEDRIRLIKHLNGAHERFYDLKSQIGKR